MKMSRLRLSSVLLLLAASQAVLVGGVSLKRPALVQKVATHGERGPMVNAVQDDDHPEVPFALPNTEDNCVNIASMTVGLDAKNPKAAIEYDGKRRMSESVCYHFCGGHRTLYMALSKGKKCTCFDVYKEDVPKEGVCNKRCRGDIRQKCGGSNSYSMHTIYLYVSKDSAEADMMTNFRNSWKQKGCFSMSPRSNIHVHLARPSTTSKRELAGMPHLKPAPLSMPPAAKAALVSSKTNTSEGEEPDWADEVQLETSSLLSYNASDDQQPKGDDPLPILGYLLDLKLTEDNLNSLYVRTVDALDGTMWGVSFAACMYDGYYLMEINNKLTLRKIVVPAEGDHQEASKFEDLQKGTFLTQPDFYEKGALTLWRDSGEEDSKVLTGGSSGLTWTEFRESDDFEKSATWVPAFAGLEKMECPPSSFKLEVWKGKVDSPEEKADPDFVHCAMSLDLDQDNLIELGIMPTDGYEAKVKGNVKVYKTGNFRVKATKEMSVKVQLDKRTMIEDRSKTVGKMRKDMLSGIIKLKKGIHRLEDSVKGGAGGQGFSVNLERVCPGKTFKSGGVSIFFPISLCGSGEFQEDCPPTHNGHLRVRCDSWNTEFSDEKGECVEKRCPDEKVNSDSAVVSFKSVTQGTSSVKETCPKTHNGELTMSCPKETEVWGEVSGVCVEKTCDHGDYQTGGTSVTFLEAPQGTGEVVVACPPTHNGKIYRTCASEHEEWTNPKGNCVEKECPEVTVQDGGASVSFKKKQQADRAEESCPPTHHGSLKMTCTEATESWGEHTGECVEKQCPGGDVKSGDATVTFPTVNQAYGAVSMLCPEDFAGTLTRKCEKETDQWGRVEGKCVHTRPHFLVKQGFWCAAGGGDLGEQESVHECAVAADKTGGRFFIYGEKTWKCQAVVTRSARCPMEKPCDWQCYLDRYPDLQAAFGPKNLPAAENHYNTYGKKEQRNCACGDQGLVQDANWDFYSISPPGWMAEDNAKCGTGPGRAVKNRDACTSSCKGDKGCECAVYYRPPGCKENVFTSVVGGPDCTARKCWKLPTCVASTCLKAEGYSTYTKTKCPARDFVSTNTKVNIAQAFSGSGGASVVCPNTHNGRISTSCVENAVVWAPPTGKCVEKACNQRSFAIKAQTVRIGNSRGNKKCVNVNTPLRCSKTAGDRNRRANTNSKANDRFDITYDGRQVCAKRLDSGGGWGMDLRVTCAENWIQFPRELQAKPDVTAQCPASHTGSMTKFCPSEQESWKQRSGDCQMKRCPATDVKVGASGASIRFAEKRQGYGKVNVNCPPTHTGTVSATCAWDADAWSPMQGSCKMKMCPHEKREGGKVVFDAVVQNTGKVTKKCPKGWSGSITQYCRANTHHWSSRSGRCRKICPKIVGGDHKANWWGSFDQTGWSIANGPITGFYRTGDSWLWNIEEASFRHYQDTKGLTCTNANWWSSFDRRGWSHCPNGYFMHGLFRNGRIGRWQNNQLYHIEEAKCCRPQESRGYGRCMNANWWSSFDRKGWSRCPNGYAMTGMYRNNCNAIYCLEEVRCCTLGGCQGR